MKKAFVVIPHWCDDQSVYSHKCGSTPVYAETSGKAKYQFMMEIEDDSNDWFKYRALRWPEKDLFDPELSDKIKSLPETAIKKMAHTYGVESNSPGHRNYYNGRIGDEDFEILIKNGLAERNSSRDKMLANGTTYFHLTDLGKKEIMTILPITREKKRRL